MAGIRQSRLEGTIRKYLSLELGRHLADPRLVSLGIEGVDLSRDLGVATVRVRLMFDGEEEGAQKAALAALRSVGPSLRSSLAQTLSMRRVPELRFVYDHGEDYRRKVEQLLGEIQAAPKGSSGPGPSGAASED